MFNGELVERQVAVVGLDDPVAPPPHVAFAIALIAAGVGVPRPIQPAVRHPLTIARGIEQPVHDLFIGVPGHVGQECFHLGYGRRQSRQIEGDSTDERGLVGFGRGVQSLLLQSGQNEVINRRATPVRRLDRRQCGALWRDEGPVLLPGRPLFDPPFKNIDLLGRQLAGELGGWHAFDIVGAGDPLKQLAVRQVGRDNRAAAVMVGPGTRFGVQAQFRLALLLVGAVALKAVIGQDGPHIAVEFHQSRLGSARDSAHQDQQTIHSDSAAHHGTVSQGGLTLRIENPRCRRSGHSRRLRTSLQGHHNASMHVDQ